MRGRIALQSTACGMHRQRRIRFAEALAVRTRLRVTLLSSSGLAGRCDSRLERNTVIGPGGFRRLASADLFRPFGVLVISILIRRDQVPTEVSQMAPALKNHSAIKLLSLCGDDDTVVLAICAGVGFAPVKFERLKLERVQRKKQVLGPLVAVAAFLQAMIDEKIVEN